jgi:hypothetical protein
MHSSEDFLVCRQFGFLHSRVLLYRQDELCELEQKLLSMDKTADQDDKDLLLRSRRCGERYSSDTRDLINTIDDKLKEYNDIVQRTRSFSSLERATKRNWSSVHNWLNNNGPMLEAEASAFRKTHDLVMIVDAKEGRWFDGHIETMLGRLGGSIGRVSVIQMLMFLLKDEQND